MKRMHVKEHLSAYMDKMLTDSEARRVEDHLQGCAECKTHLTELENMVRWLKKVPKPSLNFGLEARMMAQLQEKQRKKGLFRFSWQTVSGGLVTAAVGLFVVVMVHDMRMDQKSISMASREEPLTATKAPSANINRRMHVRSVLSQPDDVSVDSVKKLTDSDKTDSLRGAHVVEERKIALKAVGGMVQGKDNGLSGEMKLYRGRGQLGLRAGTAELKEEEFGLRKSAVASQPERMGRICDIKLPEEHVIRSKVEWDNLLKRMGDRYDGSLFPSLDFSYQMVLAVFMGEQPSAGHAISIVSETIQSEPQGQVLMVEVRKSHPPKAADVATVLTQPFHLKVRPLFSGPVEFQTVN